ncbi:HAD family hydrolase [Paenibacillus aurantiacus]|uniref:HAD family hydrolase n=1 Tax=Paenibacillus aurantiacus TaxID=1936118 RepID=A0ABV5KXA1_9BACL
MIKAVVFDFDGLILDTETCEIESYRQLYAMHGVAFPEEVYLRRIGGRDSFDPYEDMRSRAAHLHLEHAALKDIRRGLFEERFRSEQARAGVVDYLEEAGRLGLRIGLASSSSQDWVVPLLARLGLREHFECIRTFDYVKRAKPDPELYQLVLAEFGIQPEEAIAFEDSPNGSLAAVRAGMHCVIVPNPTTSGMEFPNGVRRRLASMADVTLGELIRDIEAEWK